MLCLLFFLLFLRGCLCNNCIQPNGPYEQLHPGECLFSAKKKFKFCYSTSACITNVATNIVTWCPFTTVPHGGNPYGIFAKMDGSVVAVSTTGETYWKIDPGALGYLILRDDGNLVYYKSLGGTRWSCYGLNNNPCPANGPTGVTTCQNTLYPTFLPTRLPSYVPTMSPTINPTNAAPSSPPTNKPSPAPTTLPSLSPTAQPTLSPSSIPTTVPSLSPTAQPTLSPSSIPTAPPSTVFPTISLRPTFSPTSKPTPSPTIETLHPTFPKLNESLEFFEIQAQQSITGVNFNALDEETLNEVIKFAIVSCLPLTQINNPATFISYQASFPRRASSKCGSDKKQAILITYSLSIISSWKPSTTVLTLKYAVETGKFTRTLHEQGVSYNSSAFQLAQSCDFQVSTKYAETEKVSIADNRTVLLLLCVPLAFCVIGSLVMGYFTIFPK